MVEKTPTLGQWKIERKSDTEIVVTLPDGMTITGDDIRLEDVLAAIANYQAIQSGRAIAKCCSGNMAIAIVE